MFITILFIYDYAYNRISIISHFHQLKSPSNDSYLGTGGVCGSPAAVASVKTNVSDKFAANRQT